MHNHMQAQRVCLRVENGTIYKSNQQQQCPYALQNFTTNSSTNWKQQQWQKTEVKVWFAVKNKQHFIIQ